MINVIDLAKVSTADVGIVGGKNASTGEMIQHLMSQGIHLPLGFATTVKAYQEFLAQNGLDKRISDLLESTDFHNIDLLNRVSEQIRNWILSTPFLPDFERDIHQAYAAFSNQSVAVRSSATTEDLVTASFAGAQDTFLNITGVENVLEAIKLVFASLFTSRAIAYRHDNNYHFSQIGMSVGVQQMIRSDQAVSGVMFTLDPESGFDKVIVISATYGLGEAIVKGQVNPDEFLVYKPNLEKGLPAILQRKLGGKAIKIVYTQSHDANHSIQTVPVDESERKRFCLTDQEIETLAKYAFTIEKHYNKPMDIEWAKDGIDGKLYIVQARPETVKSQQQHAQAIENYILLEKSAVLTQGQSVGQKIGAGVAKVITNTKQINIINPGDVLVTDMTDPDWEPIMKRAAAIVTNRGGRTCHAAIIARELGIPAIVGCTNATDKINHDEMVTVSCADGQTGFVYKGKLNFEIEKIAVNEIPVLPVKLCINLGNPERAFVTQFLPNDGVGLARLEFIISDMIGIHPNACLAYDSLPIEIKRPIDVKASAYANPTEFYVEKLKEGIAVIAAAFYPKEVIFRFSDFKSNEYANLLGGQLYEMSEENPMIGFRGASRYKSPSFTECFELECLAFKRVREEMHLTNAQVMIPFVRTVKELQDVLELMAINGLQRGKNDLKVYMMCEIPSNVILAKEFLNLVDGFSIGSNDLTQLTLGLDRDSSLVADLFDERNDAVKWMLHHVIEECKSQGKYIGICGQGPSDHADFAEWLMQEGIQAISLNPDTIIKTWVSLAEKIKVRKAAAVT